MSKIGKKYTLQSTRSKETKAANDYFITASKGLTMSEFREDFNTLKQYYEGKIVFSGDNKNIKKLSRYAKETLPSGPVADTKFDIDTHYEELKEINLFSASLGSAISFLKYRGPLEYNFLVKNYENYLNANPSISEVTLPNFYSVLTKSVEEENYLGFDGTSFYETPAAVIDPNNNIEPETRVIPSKVVIKSDELSLDVYLNKFNSFKEQFPFYTDISFDTHELDEKSIASVLHKKDLLTDLMELVATNAVPTELFFNETEKIGARVLNIESFLRTKLDEALDGDFTFIFDINQRIDNKSRTFLEILKGDKEYTEVIGYHLKKYDGTTAKLIQEWYLPNLSTGQMNWVDTQIKYNKLYTYKLDPIVLSFTTVYEFTEFIYSENDFTIEFINRPVVKVYILHGKTTDIKQNLGSSYTNKLLDYPPIEPEIEIIPFIGVPDKVKLNLNTAIGRKTVPAVDFSPEEDIKKDELRMAQNRSVDSPLLTYQSDDPAIFIDIYRIDKKPKSYEDFFGNILQVLSTNGAAGASYLDTIEPNKKYYYIARCVDFHDNISNPTLVYEVEIQQDGNLIFPIIKQVEFDRQEVIKQDSKVCRRYIKIQPAIRHRIPNEQKTDSNVIELGMDEETPWNKRFKMRLTSKSSGKKIDVNFTFRYKKPGINVMPRVIQGRDK